MEPEKGTLWYDTIHMLYKTMKGTFSQLVYDTYGSDRTVEQVECLIHHVSNRIEYSIHQATNSV